MVALVQRVSCARVIVNSQIVGDIGPGLLVFVGVRRGDTIQNSQELSNKIVHLRLFPDATGKMNKSVKEIFGELLIVSQFTLYGDTSKGTRPSFSDAAPVEEAEILYEDFVLRCRGTGLRVATGVFQAHMQVELTNDGPASLLCRSEK